jgi:hypothetical protein
MSGRTLSSRAVPHTGRPPRNGVFKVGLILAELGAMQRQLKIIPGEMR